MNYLLTKGGREWFLAAFIPYLNGYNVHTRVEPQWQRQRFHFHEPTGAFVWTKAPVADLKWFPEPRCHGRRIWIEGWSRESLTPKLRCHAGFNYPEVVRGNAVASELAKWDQWKQWALAHGWIKGWESHHGTTESEACAELPPEDLELEEGPPPAGEFRPGPQ